MSIIETLTAKSAFSFLSNLIWFSRSSTFDMNKEKNPTVIKEGWSVD